MEIWDNEESGKEEARRRRTSLKRLAAWSCIPEGSIEGLVGEGLLALGQSTRVGQKLQQQRKTKTKQQNSSLKLSNAEHPGAQLSLDGYPFHRDPPLLPHLLLCNYSLHGTVWFAGHSISGTQRMLSGNS